MIPFLYDLLFKKVGWFRLCQFIEMEGEPQQLDWTAHKKDWSAEVPAFQLLSGPVTAESVWNWYNRLEKKEVQTFEEICGKTLQQFGYAGA